MGKQERHAETVTCGASAELVHLSGGLSHSLVFLPASGLLGALPLPLSPEQFYLLVWHFLNGCLVSNVPVSLLLMKELLL